MTPEHILTNYADLLDTGDDSATLTLLADLDALYTTPVPQRAGTPFSSLLAQPTCTSSVQPSSPPLFEGGVPSGPRAGGWSPPVSDEQPPPGHLRQWLAFAAAVLAFALVGALLVVLFRDQQDDGPRTAAPIPPTTSSEVRDILYVSQNGDQYAIQSVRSDGTQPRVVFDGNGAVVQNPSWSPDGTRIAFASDMDGPFSIYTMNADGSDIQRLTTPEQETLDESPIWSPDGSSIAFSRTYEPRSTTDLLVIRADGSGLTNLTNLDDYIRALWPTWSSDGSRLAFVRYRPTGYRTYAGDTYLIGADGSGLQRLTDIPGGAMWPSWSPDDEHITFVVSPPNQLDTRIYVVDSTGADPVVLTPELSDYELTTWSPDGQYIAFSRRVESHRSIWIMRPDGSDLQQVTSDDDVGSLSGLRWSPDGQHLAYMTAMGALEESRSVGDEEYHPQLIVIDRNGSNRRVVVDDIVPGGQPVWSPLPVNADPPTPIASPTAATFTDQFRAALATLPEDQRGCQSTPMEMDATGLPEIAGHMLIGDGDMAVQIAGAGEGSRNLTAGTQGIFLITMPEPGFARLSVTATDSSGARELTPDCWQVNVIGEQSASVVWLQIDPASRDLGTPTRATLDNLRMLDPGEGWLVRFQVSSDWREDAGALSRWTVERIERVLPDGTRQRHVIAWDDTGAVVAELINDGERWWWNQRGWQESGSLAAGIAPMWLDLSAGMFEPETAVQMLSTTDPVQIEQFTEDDVVITRYRNNTRNINERLNPPVADRYYEIRQSADPPGHVLLTRWVNIDEAGTEIELYRQVFEDFVRTDATAISDAEFAIPAAASDKRQMQYTPPAALPAGFTLDRQWFDSLGAIEQLDISGFGIDVEVDISASRGGFDPRQTVADAAQSGNITHTLETAVGSVTWLSTPDDPRPFLAIWDNGRYRFQLTASPTDGADWNEEVLRSLVESLADHGLS